MQRIEIEPLRYQEENIIFPRVSGYYNGSTFNLHIRRRQDARTTKIIRFWFMQFRRGLADNGSPIKYGFICRLIIPSTEPLKIVEKVC